METNKNKLRLWAKKGQLVMKIKFVLIRGFFQAAKLLPKAQFRMVRISPLTLNPSPCTVIFIFAT